MHDYKIYKAFADKCAAQGVPFQKVMMAYADKFDTDLGDSDSEERLEAKRQMLADEGLFQSLLAAAKRTA